MLQIFCWTVRSPWLQVHTMERQSFQAVMNADITMSMTGQAMSQTDKSPAIDMPTNVHINQFLMMTPSQILRMSEEQAEGARGSALGRVPAVNQTTPGQLSSDTKPYQA